MKRRIRRSLPPSAGGLVDPRSVFPIHPPLPVPDGVSEDALREWLGSVCVADASPAEMRSYCDTDFGRFVRTLGLLDRRTGRALELGANPYFTTMLLREFTDLELELANYFGDSVPNGRQSQVVHHPDRATGAQRTTELAYEHFNIEEDTMPWPDGTFDVVLFCEILEHLLHDPCHVLREIRRVLSPDGVLILTTPNVARLQNVVAMVEGVNMYDPYSAYGPYGRHNREYTKHDLYRLLRYLGFDIEVLESADVHPHTTDVRRVAPLVRHREHDLGQYLFCRARVARPDPGRLPSFLYRSYPPDALDDVS